MTVILKDSNERNVSVNAGESCNVVVEFLFAGTVIPKADLATVTVTLYNESTSAIINSRSAQNIYDTNNGSITSAGVMTLRLGPLDNVIVGTVTVGDTQVHICRFTFTWSDGVATRTGIEEVAIRVLKMATPA